MRSRTSLACAIALLLVAVAGGASGCSSAKADPLELTYYYLPG